MSAPNAQPAGTVLRTGRRRLLFGVLFSAVLIALGLVVGQVRGEFRGTLPYE
ncbi:hypothetical protein AB0L13_32845 [Saccharopolyspora shandongensis]|uniref:hypothetical protein n=1 Tax=Saccharopolyspora shandongensis TaxID=418495 RepID=UPI003449F43B